MEPHADRDRDDRGARDEGLDLARLPGVLAARKTWIMGSTVAAFLAAVAFVVLVTPRYTAFTKVKLENQESYYTRPDKAVPDPNDVLDAEAVQSEAETVSSVDIARKAVEKLDLTRNDEFNPSTSLNPFTILTSLIGSRGSGSIEDRAVDAFLARLTVYPETKSRVLHIEFSSSDPALAKRAADTVAQLFLEEKEDAKRARAKAAATWLSSRIEQLRARVAEADAKVEAFRADSGLFAGTNGVTTPTQQLDELTTQIAAARAAQSAATAKAQLLRDLLRGGRLEGAPDVVKDESLRHYAEERVNLKAQIAELSRTLLPGHPRMKELEGQLAGLETEIREAVVKAVRGLEDEAKLEGSQVASLENVVAKQSKTVAAGNVDEVKLHALELDAKTAREQLESYIGKYREAAARDADNAIPPDAIVIATAEQPRVPTFPKKLPTILLATLAGFFLSAGAALARALLVEPSAEAMPVRADGSARTATDAPGRSWREPASEEGASAEEIVDRLAGAAGRGASTAILVTGEQSRGALAIALLAARRLSKRDRAVLVDLGISQPWLGDVLDRPAGSRAPLYGLSDLLEGLATFDQAIHRDLSARLDILPAGAGEIDGGALEPVFAALAQSYAFVVIHASDWRSPEAASVLEHVDAVIPCAPARNLAATRRRLREAAPDPGIVTAGVPLAGRDPLERVA
jgi:uncharacterized protein involved in exopolysaccharide biosynthesis